MDVPGALRDGVGRTREGAAWLTGLPGLVDAAVDRWDLDLGAPYGRGSASWTAPARCGSGPWRGRDVVVKVSFPHEEAAPEAEGLRWWRGRGAVGLLDLDGWTLLLDRLDPGVALADSPGDDASRLGDAAVALARLHATDPGGSRARAEGSAVEGFPALRVVCAAQAVRVLERHDRARRTGALPGLDVGVVRGAVDLLGGLPGSVPPVLVHGDANPGNLLSDGDGWTWIDPKPSLGDPAYDPWPVLEQVGDPFAGSPEGLGPLDRVGIVADVLGIDPARVVAWAWARGVESGLWTWAVAGDVAGALRELDRATAWARLVV